MTTCSAVAGGAWQGLRTHAAVLACALATAVAGPDATAQPMSPGEVSVEALNDALAPPAEAASSSGPKARGFRPSVVRPAAPVQGPSAPAARAEVMITFVTNSAELTAESRAALDIVARAMNGDRLSAYSFIVEGHADPRGDATLNLELSRLRADAVVDYLANEHGIARERLSAVGRGSAEPWDPRRPEAPENRRVTFVTRPN